MSYAVLLAGYPQLALRGARKQIRSSTSGDLADFSAEDWDTDLAPEVIRQLRTLGGPLELASAAESKPLQILPDDVGKEILTNGQYILPFVLRSAGSLLILAYETTRPYNDQGHLWEFLRHCRNAAAHNGRFQLDAGEPRREAKWKSLQFHEGMHGTPLFGGPSGAGLLGPADPIRLLWDIEQAYPAMSIPA